MHQDQPKQGTHAGSPYLKDIFRTALMQASAEITALTEDDFLHVLQLLQMAREALPESTDSDASRAALRAAMEFLSSKQPG